MTDPAFGNRPVDMDLSVLLGKPPKMIREATHINKALVPFDMAGLDLRESAYRVLRLPAVADKTFLISIGDRSVGGMTARDQMVGPWQVPVADVAVTLMGYRGYLGEAFAVGERTPVALIDPAASARMAVGEAITNMAAASIERLGEIKLSANWMAAAGHPGEDAGLFDAVRGDCTPVADRFRIFESDGCAQNAYAAVTRGSRRNRAYTGRSRWRQKPSGRFGAGPGSQAGGQ